MIKPTKPIQNKSYSHLFAALVLPFLLANTSHANPPTIEKRSLSTESSASSQAQTSTEWQLYQKILVLDEEITQLRDKVERMEAALVTAKKQQKKYEKSLNQRLVNQENVLIEVVDTLEATQTKGSSETAANTQKNGAATKIVSAAAATKATATKQSTAVAKLKNTASAKTEIKASTTAQPNTAKKPATNSYAKPTDEEAAKKAYLAAYDVFRKKGKQAGVQSMSKFINTYPKSRLVPSAHFWIGEFYLSGGEPDLVSAELSFTTVLKRFPKSQKVPKSLYRLGYIAHLNKKNSVARQYMLEIINNHAKAREVGLAKAFLKRLNSQNSKK